MKEIKGELDLLESMEQNALEEALLSWQNPHLTLRYYHYD
jgi:hypothetical protein